MLYNNIGLSVNTFRNCVVFLFERLLRGELTDNSSYIYREENGSIDLFMNVVNVTVGLKKIDNR